MDNWTVYIHTSPQGKRYVGITSQKPTDRWRNGKGYKYNTHFTRAINKYGWDNFKHEIVADNLSEENAKLMEIDLISKYKTTNQNFGYNISYGGDGVTGIRRFGADNPFYGKHHSEETKKMIRENRPDMSGVNNPFYNKHHTEETIQKITEIAKNRDCSHLNVPFTEERKNKVSERHSKVIQRFDLDMNFICEYSNLVELEKLGYRRASIRDVCLGRKDSYKGCIWKYKYNNDAWTSGYIPGTYADNIYCLDKEMNVIGIFKSYSEASREMNVHRSHISSACHSESHLYSGYRWCFKEDYMMLKEGD